MGCRPHYVVFPEDEGGFRLDDQYFIGENLLVKPVTKPDMEETEVYLPPGDDVRSFSFHSLFHLSDDDISG